MNSPGPLIGFDRYVELAWCVQTLEVATGKASQEQLKELVASALPGPESQRKTLDVLKRLSTKPFPYLSDFIGRGLEIYGALGSSAALPVAWGAAIASYPFFGKTAETTGRLLDLQGDCSIREIQRRMAEAYGERNGIERAVARVLQSQANWGVFDRDDSEKRIIKTPPMPIENDRLTAWLAEAALRFVGRPIAVANLPLLPVLFPFNLTRSLGYVLVNSPSLELRADGPSNQVVALKARTMNIRNEFSGA